MAAHLNRTLLSLKKMGLGGICIYAGWIAASEPMVWAMPSARATHEPSLVAQSRPSRVSVAIAEAR